MLGPTVGILGRKGQGPANQPGHCQGNDCGPEGHAGQQWAEAIKNLEAAETKSPLTAFDKKTIYDFKGFAYVKLNNLKEAEKAYEQALATGAYSRGGCGEDHRMLFRLTAGNQQYAKAAEYGKQVAESGSATPDDLGILSQIYYLQKDCKSSAAWADKAIAAARKAGEAPKENLYQFKLQCASDAGDIAGDGGHIGRSHTSDQQDHLLEHIVADRAAG